MPIFLLGMGCSRRQSDRRTTPSQLASCGVHVSSKIHDEEPRRYVPTAVPTFPSIYKESVELQSRHSRFHKPIPLPAAYSNVLVFNTEAVTSTKWVLLTSLEDHEGG